MHNAGTEKDGLGELQQSGWMLTTSFNYKKQWKSPWQLLTGEGALTALEKMTQAHRAARACNTATKIHS